MKQKECNQDNIRDIFLTPLEINNKILEDNIWTQIHPLFSHNICLLVNLSIHMHK